MFALVHTLTGIVIAVKIKNPYIVLPISLLSHFLLDMIPHWDLFSFKKEITRKDKINAILDVLGGLVLGLIFIFIALPNQRLASTIFFSAALANLPDALEAPLIFTNSKNPISMGMYKVQHTLHARWPLPWGLLTQLVVIGLGLWFLFFT